MFNQFYTFKSVVISPVLCLKMNSDIGERWIFYLWGKCCFRFSLSNKSHESTHLPHKLKEKRKTERLQEKQKSKWRKNIIIGRTTYPPTKPDMKHQWRWALRWVLERTRGCKQPQLKMQSHLISLIFKKWNKCLLSATILKFRNQFLRAWQVWVWVLGQQRCSMKR